ncbi:CPBP family glutamic-type intramembrane protease [Actinomycetota bacterium]
MSRLISPVAEVRAFATAALRDPVVPATPESPAAQRRRRVVVLVSLLLGSLGLGLALRVPPEQVQLFTLANVGVLAIWALGALASGPIHLGHAHSRAGGLSRGIVQSLALGALLVALFLVGAVGVAAVPVLARPVDGLFEHAHTGQLGVVALVTAASGVAEEMFFRGALFAALPARYAVAGSLVAYTLTVLGTGNPMLVLAAALLGLLTGLQRRVTGGVLGPAITHVVWSMSMLFLLPPILDALR